MSFSAPSHGAGYFPFGESSQNHSRWTRWSRRRRVGSTALAPRLARAGANSHIPVLEQSRLARALGIVAAASRQRAKLTSTRPSMACGWAAPALFPSPESRVPSPGVFVMRATGNFEKVKDVDPNVVLTDATRAHIEHWLAKFPPDRRRSAVIQGLMAAQEQNGGWLTDELIAAVAKYLQIPPIWAYEVATFYSMFQLEPVGRHNVAICTNISCWLNGAEGIVRHCEKKYGIELGQSSADSRVYLKCEEECLAACAGAPMMVVDGHYHENLTIEKVDEILDSLK